MNSIRASWLSHLISSEPADRPQAESALRDLYDAAGLPAPGYFFWLDSPFKATLAMMLLGAPNDYLFGQMVAALDRKKRDRQELDEVRGQLCRAASQPNWAALSRSSDPVASITASVATSGRTHPQVRALGKPPGERYADRCITPSSGVLSSPPPSAGSAQIEETRKEG